MPSTLIKYGNPLDDPIPQTGWTVEADGFGLLTARVTYKWDKSKASQFTSTFVKGVFSAPAPFDHLKLWKATMTVDKNEVLMISADFCGLDSNISTSKSNWQIAMVGSSASEAIEHHPNFLVVNCTSVGGSKLAGFPPPGGGFDTSLTTNPNRALWTPSVAGGGATMGYQFVGFLPNQSQAEYLAGNINIKAGIKNYYKPSITLRCLAYYASGTDAMNAGSFTGWLTDGATPFGLPALYTNLAKAGSYAGNFQYSALFASKINRTFLVTGTNVENYGSIYKVTIDLMMSGIAGWDKDVYPEYGV